MYILYIYILTLMSHHFATRPGFSGIDRFQTAPPHGSMMPCGKAPRRDVGPPLCPICWESLGSCLGLVRMVPKKMPETSWILKKYTLKIMVRWRDIHRNSNIFFSWFFGQIELWSIKFQENFAVGIPTNLMVLIFIFWLKVIWRDKTTCIAITLCCCCSNLHEPRKQNMSTKLNYWKSSGKSGWPVFFKCQSNEVYYLKCNFILKSSVSNCHSSTGWPPHQGLENVGPGRGRQWCVGRRFW